MGVFGVDEGLGDRLVLEIPHDIAAQTRVKCSLELVDPEVVPLAATTVPTAAAEGSVRIYGRPTLVRRNEFGAFRQLYLAPDQVRAGSPQAVAVPVAGPLTDRDLDLIRTNAEDRPILL